MPASFRLSSQLFSQAFWHGVLEDADLMRPMQAEFSKRSLDLESLREKADYNTGSVSAFSAWSLFLLCRYFRVLRAIEVGTFIGRSTVSIASAMNLNGGGEIHTCDLSNEIVVNQVPPTRILQYRKMTSTQMLTSLEGEFDFAFIDGRLDSTDINRLAELLTEDAILALDDFEGTEKGVANLFNLRSHPRFSSLFLVTPAGPECAARVGLTSRSLVAILLPPALITLTNQG